MVALHKAGHRRRRRDRRPPWLIAASSGPSARDGTLADRRHGRPSKAPGIGGDTEGSRSQIGIAGDKGFGENDRAPRHCACRLAQQGRRPSPWSLPASRNTGAAWMQAIFTVRLSWGRLSWGRLSWGRLSRGALSLGPRPHMRGGLVEQDRAFSKALGLAGELGVLVQIDGLAAPLGVL